MAGEAQHTGADDEVRFVLEDGAGEEFGLGGVLAAVGLQEDEDDFVRSQLEDFETGRAVAFFGNRDHGCAGGASLFGCTVGGPVVGHHDLRENASGKTQQSLLDHVFLIERRYDQPDL